MPTLGCLGMFYEMLDPVATGGDSTERERERERNKCDMYTAKRNGTSRYKSIKFIGTRFTLCSIGVAHLRRYLHEYSTLTIYSQVVTICTASLTFNNSTFCPTHYIYVFCVYIRTNSHYFPIQH